MPNAIRKTVRLELSTGSNSRRQTRCRQLSGDPDEEFLAAGVADVITTAQSPGDLREA